MGDFHFCISLTIKSFILSLNEQLNMTLKLDNFAPPNLEAWRIKIKEETKSKELVDYTNEIEAIKIDPTDKSETKNFSNLIKSDNNDWAIGAHIEVVDEENANSYAIQCLSKGVNLLYIAVNKKNIEWRRLFKGIHIEYIKIAVKLENDEQLLSLEQFLSDAKKENVSIIVSGESGSGKSFSTQILIQHLLTLARTGNHGTRLTASGPILENFGHAKTRHNNNSSRVGKFVTLNFSSHGRLTGAKVEQYLLEISRVIQRHHNERNFHIFYTLIYGLTEPERAKIGLRTAEEYEYLKYKEEDND